MLRRKLNFSWRGYRTTSANPATVDTWSRPNTPGLESRPVTVFSLAPGSQGTVVSFQPAATNIERTPEDKPEPQKSNEYLNSYALPPRTEHSDYSGSSLKITSINLGFDFDFNPVCIIYGEVVDGRNSSHLDEVSRELANCQAIGDQITTYQHMPVQQAWSEHGICILKGHRVHGLQERSVMLNLQIEIQKGWKDAYEKAWIVDIQAIHSDSLPQDQYRHADYERIPRPRSYGHEFRMDSPVPPAPASMSPGSEREVDVLMGESTATRADASTPSKPNPYEMAEIVTISPTSPWIDEERRCGDQSAAAPAVGRRTQGGVGCK